jgi:hypothetical protein
MRCELKHRRIWPWGYGKGVRADLIVDTLGANKAARVIFFEVIEFLELS